jgi:cob(I)alamin adenosyltransferase
MSEQLSLFTDEELGKSNIHLTKIYTKTGDKGITSLADNTRVKKFSPLIITVGFVDQANSAIGMVVFPEIQDVIDQIQNDLFDLGADLTGSKSIKITQEHIDWLETTIDKYNALIEPAHSFVLPTGQIHNARALVRAAELQVWWASEYEDVNHRIMIYLNRLSDLLFVLARYQNKGQEKLWRPNDGNRIQ